MIKKNYLYNSNKINNLINTIFKIIIINLKKSSKLF